MNNNNVTLHWCGLVRFSKKTGKIDTTMTGLGKGLLELWAMQNTTKTKCTMVLDLVDRCPIMECVGTEDGFPKVCKDIDSMTFDVPVELYEAMDEEVAQR